MSIVIIVLIIAALYILQMGIAIQQRIYSIDIYRNGSLTDKMERWLDAGLRTARKGHTLNIAIIAFVITTTGMPIFSITQPQEDVAVIEEEEPEEQQEEVKEEKKEEVKEEVQKVEAKEDEEEDIKEEKEESAWKEIELCDKQSPVKTYMDDNRITNRNSRQYALFNEGAYGEVIRDDIGFQYILGEDPDTGGEMKFYTVALGSYYADAIGDKFRVTLESGFTFGVIQGDFKADGDTNEGSESTRLLQGMSFEEITKNNPIHCLAGSSDMIEFIIDSEYMYELFPGRTNNYVNNGSMNYNFDEEHQFAGRIVKIEKLVE